MTRRSKRAKPPAEATEVALDVGEIVRDAEKQFVDTDAMRSNGLRQLADFRTARTHLLRRKREELAMRVGEESDAVKELDEVIAATTDATKALEAQSVVAAKPTPKPKKDESIVEGYVRDKDANARRGVKVVLADAEGRVTATAVTNDDGHFEIHQPMAEQPTRRAALRVGEDKPTTIDVELEVGAVRFIAVRTDD